MLNDYQKKLIAEGFYARLMDETSTANRILMIQELMDSCIPQGLYYIMPTIKDGTKFFELPKDNFPICTNMVGEKL